MGAYYSTITRDLTCCLVRVLDSNLAYRNELRCTLKRYLDDQSINQHDALSWTSEKYCNDLLDPNHDISKLLLQHIREFESLHFMLADRASLSSHLSRASLLLMDELKLDLAVHERLFDACSTGDLHRLIKLSKFVDFEFCDISDGCTPLLHAAHHGHAHIIAYLLRLEPKPDVSRCDAFGWTPLQHAARGGHVNVVKLLLRAGAYVDAVNSANCSALMCAAHMGHDDVVRLLIAAGASVKLTSRSGDTALIQATRNGHLQCVKALIAAGSNVDHSGAHDRTALIHAAANTRYDLIELLVAHGASLDWVDEDGASVCSFEASSVHDTQPEPSVKQSNNQSSIKPSKGVGLVAAAIQRGIVVRFSRLISRPVKHTNAHFAKLHSLSAVDEFDLNGDAESSEEQSEDESVDEHSNNQSNNQSMDDADDESNSGDDSDNSSDSTSPSRQSVSRSQYSDSRSRTGSISDSQLLDAARNIEDELPTSGDEVDTQTPGEVPNPSNGSPSEGRFVAGEDSEGESSPGAQDSPSLQKLPASLSFSHGVRAQSVSRMRPSTPPAQRKAPLHFSNHSNQPIHPSHHSHNSLDLPAKSIVEIHVPSPNYGPVRLTMEVRKPKRRAPAPVPRVSARARILALRQAAFVPNSEAARQLRNATAISPSRDENMEDSSHDSDDHKQSEPLQRASSPSTQPSPSSRTLRPLFPRDAMHVQTSSTQAAIDDEIEQVLETVICPSPPSAPQIGEASPSPPPRAPTPAIVPSPPPVILMHDSWRSHLDATPLNSWLQHYQFDERVVAQCEKMGLNFRSIYAWTEQEACHRLGTKQGQRLFSCLRSYARAVQRAYTERDQAHKTNTVKGNENDAPVSLNVPSRSREGSVKRQEARILEPQTVNPAQPKSAVSNKSSASINAASLGSFASTTASNLLATLTSTLDVPRSQHARSGSRGSDTFSSLISSLGSMNSSNAKYMES